ncbi:hypothetical protein X802_03310 [Thermococcus guaymasensis DSM 11113]|uniref:Uncharacterized protein n=1 Tax=Thermococcus guaymasensis DSM 11113 TaxID=1432656 RepID=A0A0X1KJ40_9EURY|nr:hypothetical protein [Thermococcus guaymasensis]AJC71299.1 hypothetical protein X802_03310 [Thermococcus guaymasensis DSM 11113]
MDDILLPRERRDAVVFIGVDPVDNVEFVKVYAVSEEKAKETLEKFFNARGLFPADYRLVSSGTESVEGKMAITTRTESSLSSALARLGLKLLSNGVLHLEGRETVYQLTLVSESLYEKLVTKEPGGVEKHREEPSIELYDIFSLGVDVLVENLRGVELSDYLPPEARLLREPEVSELLVLLEDPERDFPVVVETKRASKYSDFDFPVTLRLPPLTVEEFAAELSERLGFSVDPSLFNGYPPEKLNMRNVEALAKLVRALIEKKSLGPEEALRLAVRLNYGGP